MWPREAGGVGQLRRRGRGGLHCGADCAALPDPGFQAGACMTESQGLVPTEQCRLCGADCAVPLACGP
eukprot:362350-Chlamydomonas_euryale.AAC.2